MKTLTMSDATCSRCRLPGQRNEQGICGACTALGMKPFEDEVPGFPWVGFVVAAAVGAIVVILASVFGQ